MSEAANAAQIDYWNGATGDTWASLQHRLDRQLDPLGREVMAALAPKPGERALDIGCGAGQTTLELAQAVGPGGAVTGVDISRPLLDTARARSHGLAGVSFVEGDAQVFPFETAAFDLAFSRFGVMFFADPVAAFVNIRRALKPGGRLGFVCWRAPAENLFMSLPLEAARRVLPAPGEPPPPPALQGPFGFADPERARGVLEEAGFSDITIVPHDRPIGVGGLEETLEVAQRVGPLGALLRENPQFRAAAVAAIRDALAAHDGPNGVLLPSASWIVTARA